MGAGGFEPPLIDTQGSEPGGDQLLTGEPSEAPESRPGRPSALSASRKVTARTRHLQRATPRKRCLGARVEQGRNGAEGQLDKLGVTGSSPVPPTSQSPRAIARGFCVSGPVSPR